MDVAAFMDRQLQALGAPNQKAHSQRDASLVLADPGGLHDLFWISSHLGAELVRLDYGSKSSALCSQADLNENFLTLDASIGHLLTRDRDGHVRRADPYSQDEIIAEVSRNRECTYFAEFAATLAHASDASWKAIAALPRFDALVTAEAWAAFYRGDVRAIAALDHVAGTLLARIDVHGCLKRHEGTGVQIAIEGKKGAPQIFAGQALDLYIALQTAHILSAHRSEGIFRIRQHEEISWYVSGHEEAVNDFCHAITASTPDRPASSDLALPHELSQASAESSGCHILYLDELLAEERERRSDLLK